MKALIVADPVESLKPASDTSLHIARELIRQKIETHLATDLDLVWENKSLVVASQKILKKDVSSLSRAEKLSITDFSLIFIRKNPPFDSSYVKLCWLLAPYENKVRIINSATSLLRFHEKMLPLEGFARKFLREGDILLSCLASNLDQALESIQKWKTEKIVIKPFFGFGGSDIFLVNRKNFKKEASKYFKKSGDWILQPFEESVKRDGDLRVFFLLGRFVGCFARIPKRGSHVSNLAQGGSALLRDLTQKEEEVIRRLEKWVQDCAIDFVGADLIAGRVNELNITSPTGFVSYEGLTGQNLSQTLIDGVLKSSLRSMANT